MPTRHPTAQRSQIRAEDEEQLAEGNGRKTPDGRREDRMWYQAGNPTPKRLWRSKPFPDVREVREVGEEAGCPERLGSLGQLRQQATTFHRDVRVMCE
ncbi:hypothetical protein CPLU01_02150 [Colletotrichum plurivorum]|uniref:Uncharacterized protein n=1 Tax=Colletotrichum plurivorum TaxID=2175906 RepID=A0A8H6NN95_9PEZI|nr:hypothetical protein CPLU01_02150 [Colletotrichum plurivorum]